MENYYGIGVTNRYALFLDDEQDPLEALKIQESAREQKKKSKIVEKENKTKTEVAPKPKVAVPPRKNVKETPIYKPPETKREDNKNTTKGGPEARTKFATPGTDTREERNNKRNRDDRPINGPPNEAAREERPRRDFVEGEGRRGRGGVTRGARTSRGRPFDQRGKREFDRQSGSDKTGVKPVDKRDGAGAHNWGSHKDIIEEADKADAEPGWEMDKPDAQPTQPETNKETTEGGEGPSTTDDEPKQFTLDEWRAQKANRQKPTYNLRKAGEGEDPSQWKKMYELNKKKEGDTEESEEEEYDATEYPQRVGRQKHVLDIDIHFNDSRRGTVGGRGRGRGAAGRGARGIGGGSHAAGQSISTGGAATLSGTQSSGPMPGLSSRTTDREGRERPGGMRNFRNQSGGNNDTSARAGGNETEDHEHHSNRIESQRPSRPNAPKVDDEHDFPSLN